MKKILKLVCSVYKEHRKILVIMRNSIFIILISALQVIAGSSYSQTAKLNLDLKVASIKEVLQAIEKQSEFYFLYNSELIDVTRKMDISVQGEKVDEILARLFDKNEVNVLIKDRHIILSPVAEMTAQQQKSVSGKVTDNSGTPLPGISVVVKGTTTGTITDASGGYSLTNVSDNATLLFSFVGMKSREIAVAGKLEINTTMEEETIGLDEVVAIGYGTQKKVNLTGAISDFRSNQIEDKPVTKVSQLFAGQTTGLSSTQMSGEPGEDIAAIIIRGRGTFSSAGVEALVLIDRLPSSLDNLDPNTIESISVLKDAASAAIYGARAANGVILVTTKRGQSGKLNITFNGYAGWNKPAEFADVVDSWQYAECYNGGRFLRSGCKKPEAYLTV
jgi:TonB-dependent starch-binding outer membrane protein SusC